uniref:Uncharacterized protein n=1 Tax=Timema monikensis TaxID=170555 RepID=A0A7R9E3Z7_9NEOP|nr:unnamed protein product [Timema monikensis]
MEFFFKISNKYSLVSKISYLHSNDSTEEENMLLLAAVVEYEENLRVSEENIKTVRVSKKITYNGKYRYQNANFSARLLGAPLNY